MAQKNRGIICKTCDSGTMYRAKLHRMSGPTVVIGYILLIPSILGILIAILMSVMSVVAAPKIQEESIAAEKQKLLDGDVPPALAEKIIQLKPLDDEERNGLSDEQKDLVDNSTLAVAASSIGSGFAIFTLISGFLCFGFLCFVGGLVGWILTMRKKVLQCSNCKAVLSAS